LRAIVIIPARYKSSRFPGKPLIPLLGKPMIIWVAEVCAKAVGTSSVYIATDHEGIRETVENAGYKAIMTSSNALTGTDRLAEAASKVDADIYINVQGDEPLLDPDDILKIIQAKQKNINHVINGFTWLEKNVNPDNVNIPKVITNERSELIYMSRRALPGYKESINSPSVYKKQVCIYAFSKHELESFHNYRRKSTLEQCEDIEILRFLELGIPILMVETKAGSLAVDVPEDVPLVEIELRKTINV
jgi:3-deoxy-manno-octulosonate cytidylyltransferase (CMP-KDO synthetase)